MLPTILLSFLAGLVGTNAIPHFFRGITADEYPNVTGNGPVNNVVGGWVAFVAAGLLAHVARPGDHPVPAVAAAAVGVLAMAVFHARGGAYRMNDRFGRPNPARAARSGAAGYGQGHER